MQSKFKNIKGRGRYSHVVSSIFQSIILLAILLLAFSISGCKKLVDVKTPDNSITSGSVYSSDGSAIAVLTGIYTKLSSNDYGGTASIPTISLWAGLSADELTLSSGAPINQVAQFNNSLSVNTGGFEFWINAYQLVYYCNAAIEGLNTSSSLTPAVKQQLLGEAKFLRAFFYFYLVNLYGDVPLALSTDYTINASLSRSPKVQVYNQIIKDLKDAQGLLVDGYVEPDATTLYPSSSAERVRPNRAAATALLARTYLYTGDWINAETQASALINNTTYYSLPSLNNVFLKNSLEAIWQLQPVTNGNITNTAEAAAFILSYAPAGLNSSHPVYLSFLLIDSFEVGDQRQINWVNSYTDASGTYYYASKYKVAVNGTGIIPTEYTMLLRLGEQYLIRAEARAQLGNLSGTQSDLNAIRARAGLANTTATTQAALLTAIQHERQVELFTELGHRWLDLKRTNTIDAVMTITCPLKGGSSWNSFQQLYPLPLEDLQKDGNLIQNSGY